MCSSCHKTVMSAKHVRRDKIRTNIGIYPYARFAHSANEIGAGKEHHADLALFAVLRAHATKNGINFVVEVIEDDGGALVALERLPSVHHQPCIGVLGG